MKKESRVKGGKKPRNGNRTEKLILEISLIQKALNDKAVSSLISTLLCLLFKIKITEY